jgi:hypothetical protein
MTDLTIFAVEFSYEATTLDYLAPNWYVSESFSGEDAALVEETAEAAAVAARAEYDSRHGSNAGPCAFRASNRTPQPVVETDYEAIDAMWNARYWSDRARAAEASQAAEERYMERTKRGMPVRVVKGRKVPIGTEGHVFWSDADKYSRTGGWRIGFKDAAGETHWTSADNVEVIEQVAAVAA